MSSNNTGSWDDIITKILLQIERKRGSLFIYFYANLLIWSQQTLLSQTQGGSDFVHPVEHEKLGLNDYLDIVKVYHFQL